MSLEAQDVNSWLFSLKWGWGVWVFCLFFKHNQTVLKKQLIYQALLAKICMHLIALGQASVHSLGSGWWGNSMCLGTVRAVLGLGVLRAAWQKGIEEEKSLWAVWDNLTWELRQARTRQQIMLLFLRLIFIFSYGTLRLGEWREEKLSNFSLSSFFPSHS